MLAVFPRMRTIALAGLALLGAGLATCRADAPRGPPPTPPVWAIAQGETTVYLFGAAHLLTPQARWRSPTLEAAFADAERMVFEVVPGPAMVEETQILFDRHGRNPPGVTLSSLLTPEEAQSLARIAARLGLPLDAVEAMRPWLAAQQIALAGAMAQGARAELGVEAQLLAQGGERAVDALETPAQQIATLAGLSPDDELAMLRTALRDAEEDPEAPLRAQAAWAAGDLAAIEALALEARAEVSPAFYEAVITARNRRFAEAASAYLGEGDDVLFVVGAAHLVGDEGVIALLRAQGYPVTGP